MKITASELEARCLRLLDQVGRTGVHTKHWRGSPTDPDRLDRMPNAGDEKLVRDYLGKHLPSANGTTLAFKVCMYTWGGPWLGPLPGTKHVTVIAACDGGGFKFSSAYGEALADLVTEGETSLPVGFMKP